MADLPDYYTQAQISEAEAAGIKGGLDANKSATPVSRDIYLATDTHILYVCFADGIWTGFDAATITQGTLTFYANVVGGGFEITNIADPTAAQSAATRAYVLANLGSYLPLTGGAMTGAIAMGTNKITGLGDPAAAQEAATKVYTDGAIDADIATHTAIVAAHHARYTDADAKAAAVQAGAITNGVTKAPTHDAVYDVKQTADTATTPAEVAADIATHAALTTGVHGAGASTLATVANIATHAGLTTGVHGVGASTIASVANIATHAALTTGVHGSGASYLALAAGSQYTAVNRAGDTGLGLNFKREGEDSGLYIWGGQDYPGRIQCMGKNAASYPGSVEFRVTNAAKDGHKIPLRISGVTDTPIIYPNVDNQTSLGQPTRLWSNIYTTLLNVNGDAEFNSHKLTGVAAPVAATDAARKSEVDTVNGKLDDVSQTDQTASRAVDGTVYRNTSGKIRVVTVTVDAAVTTTGTSTAIASCDSAAAPTTVVAKVRLSAGLQTGDNVTIGGSITFIVAPNYYYKVVGTGSPTLYRWLEWDLL